MRPAITFAIVSAIASLPRAGDVGGVDAGCEIEFLDPQVRARAHAGLIFRFAYRSGRLSNMRSKHEAWSDREILSHGEEIALLRAVAAGQVIRGPRTDRAAAPYLLDGETVRLNLAWLARQDLITMPLGAEPRLLPRGRRLLQIANGEIPPLDDG